MDVKRIVAVLLLLLIGGLPGFAQSRPNEYQVKAAYLFNFGKFVTGASGAAQQGASFPICVIGQDPFGPALDAALSGETIGGKTVVARRIANVEEAAMCGILFISSSEESRLSTLLMVLGMTRVLTVSDIPRFAQRGGMIGFVLDGSRVRFEVDLGPVERTGLMLSSELLRVASTVRRPERGD